jgi:hypothetical protein
VSQENIRRVLELADERDWEDGMHAYPRHRETLRMLSDYYGFTLSETVAAFCALSPNNDYMGNLRSTVTLMKGIRQGKRFGELTISTYRGAGERAWRFLHGELFLDVTKGKKTRAFYQNIMDPSDPVPVTVDGHMMSVWLGERLTMKEAVMKKLNYDVIAEDIRQVARIEGLIPNRVQSVLWFTWKRLHRVLYREQTDLFFSDDHWRLLMRPDEIKAYYI